MASHPEGPSHEKCAATVLSALKHAADCGAPKLQCTFNGAWGGNRVPDVFYISSYFWDRATDAGGLVTAGALCVGLPPRAAGRVASVGHAVWKLGQLLGRIGGWEEGLG
jgi:hypothetical protein